MVQLNALELLHIWLVYVMKVVEARTRFTGFFQFFIFQMRSNYCRAIDPDIMCWKIHSKNFWLQIPVYYDSIPEQDIFHAIF